MHSASRRLISNKSTTKKLIGVAEGGIMSPAPRKCRKRITSQDTQKEYTERTQHPALMAAIMANTTS